jgi:DNA-binding HxlR family transcriptional regulator
VALPKEYAGNTCSLSRALEVVGERWTLLVVRDAFFGVRRFGDFAAHLGVPRAVLTERLASLVEAEVFEVARGAHGYDEYVLTEKGVELWPVVRGLLTWGDDYYSAVGPKRVFEHADDGGAIRPDGVCVACGGQVAPRDLVVLPGPGLGDGRGDDYVSNALAVPHRMLEPIR